MPTMTSDGEPGGLPDWFHDVHPRGLPTTLGIEMIELSASRYADNVGSSIVAVFLPARFSRLTEIVAGARGNTICVNNPLRTESALTSAPGYSESEFAAYATMRSN